MTPLALPVGDPGFPKSPGAFDLVVHFLEWKMYCWNNASRCVQNICQSKCAVRVGTELDEVRWVSVQCVWYVRCVCCMRAPAQCTRMCRVRAGPHFQTSDRAQLSSLALYVKIFLLHLQQSYLQSANK